MLGKWVAVLEELNCSGEHVPKNDVSGGHGLNSKGRGILV